MAKYSIILLLCGLAVSAQAMGYVRYPNSNYDHCDCEPGEEKSTTPSIPTTTTPTTTTPTTTTPTTTTPTTTTPTTTTPTTTTPTTTTPTTTTPTTTTPTTTTPTTTTPTTTTPTTTTPTTTTPTTTTPTTTTPTTTTPTTTTPTTTTPTTTTPTTTTPTTTTPTTTTPTTTTPTTTTPTTTTPTTTTPTTTTPTTTTPTTTTPTTTTPTTTTPTTTTPTTTTPTTTTPTTTTPTTTSTTSPSTVTPTHIVRNCTSGILYNRNATAANNYTAYWCIIIFVNSEPQNTTDQDARCKERYGPNVTVTIPENAAELASINLRFRNFWLRSNFNGTIPVIYTLAVDGHLKPSCSPLNSCNSSTSFEFSDNRTDPAFILTQWKAGQPNPQYSNGIQKECLGIDEDDTLRNIFCDGGTSPIIGNNGTAEYVVHGFVCGAPAIEYVIPGLQ